MWIINDGNGGAKIDSKKTGTWTANDTLISISIQGNSGMITEDFILENNVFKNTLTKDRYLKKN